MLRAALGALLCALAVLRSGAQTNAQTMGPLTVRNNTTCPVTMCDASGTACATVAPGNTTTQILCTTGTLTIQTCGTLRKIPLFGSLTDVNLGACCANISFTTGFVGCTFFLVINTAAGPCPCP
ncbi:MAG TPA: hypothetical protein VHI13_01650 [Candidatus Kapabacteria bacterium]|nr:hypothetical protein [Candidatus Kapabacteria bacterium]